MKHTIAITRRKTEKMNVRYRLKKENGFDLTINNILSSYMAWPAILDIDAIKTTIKKKTE